MTVWQRPSFEELAMNAEIGSYQAEDGDAERRNDAPAVALERDAARLTAPTSALRG